MIAARSSRYHRDAFSRIIFGPSRPESFRAEDDPLPRFRFTAVSSALVASAIVTVAGCYHIVSPPSSPAIAIDEVSPLASPPARAIALANDYEEENVRWIRAEGTHHLGLDLREWTDRLIGELLADLATLEVTAFRASSENGDSSGAPTVPSLRVRVTDVVPPSSPSAGPARVAAAIESRDGEYRGEFHSSPSAGELASALHSLKLEILEDASFRAWILAAPNADGDARPLPLDPPN